MDHYLNAVKQFQEVFGHFNNTTPTALDMEARKLRFGLAKEELDEYLLSSDLEGQVDAIVDQLYVLCGTILAHGLQGKIQALFDAVHESNMSKLGEDGKPLLNGFNTPLNGLYPVGKVLKGPNYFKPDERIREILSK